MAAFSTTVTKQGMNAYTNISSTGRVSLSTATTAITLTYGDLSNVVMMWTCPAAGTTSVVLTISASTAEGYAQTGRGNMTITSYSSDYGFISGLDSNWFGSTSKVLTITATTAIA